MLLSAHEGVFSIEAPMVVGQLLAAKRDLRLEAELKKLDRYQVVILDDIGYVQQNREEMEVLFTFLAERYERRPVMISSNLVFSQWDQIFKDKMTTMCASEPLIASLRSRSIPKSALSCFECYKPSCFDRTATRDLLDVASMFAIVENIPLSQHSQQNPLRRACPMTNQPDHPAFRLRCTPVLILTLAIRPSF